MPFRDLAGHRHLFELLARAAVRGTLPPSLLFAGPAGVGKRAAAIALAQLVNCVSRPAAGAADGSGAGQWGPGERPSRGPGQSPGPLGRAQGGPRESGAGQWGPRERPSRGPGQSPGLEEDACGVCTACRRIARGVHPDVVALEPGESGVIKIDQAREVIAAAAYRPFEGRRRLVIVDPADALNVDAQNALLKTLEEPPPSSTFVLVTARPDVLLPTVQSRCQRVRFGRLTEAEIAGVLMAAHRYDRAGAHAAAAAADGSLGRALEGASAEFAGARDAAARVLAGATESADPAARLGLARDLMAGGGGGRTDREALARRLRALSSLVRDLGVLGADADDRWLANGDLRPALDALRRSWDRDRALRAFAAVDRALGALERNASPKVVADWLAVEL